MEASGGSPAPAREWRERTAVQSGKFGVNSCQQRQKPGKETPRPSLTPRKSERRRKGEVGLVYHRLSWGIGQGSPEKQS